jgi:acyl-CoA synthetase (AMP-forming)/AMP-acid ligase II
MSGTLISGARVVPIADMQVRAARAATGLAALGVGRGDAVALFLRNDIATFEAGAAAGLLGAYAVPINFHLVAEEAGYILRDCGARVLVVHADLLPRIEDGIPGGVTVLVVATPEELAAAHGVDEDAAGVPSGWVDWSDWLTRFAPWAAAPVPAPGAMIYTSGTTGRPKGVRRTPVNESEMLALYAPIITALGLRPGIRTVIPAPLYHSAPNTYAALSVRLGAEKIVLMPRFEPEALLALIETHRITHVQTVPTMFVRLLKLPEAVRHRYDVSSLEFVVHAAAPCPREVKQAMIDWWGPILTEYYAGTEGNGLTLATCAEWQAHRGTVGRAVVGAVKIVDDATGEVLPAGAVGGVWFAGGPRFEYNNSPEKTAAAHDARGWSTLGDVGYLDDDGFLHLTDCKAYMIISGGVNIYPQETEDVLVGHPAVLDAAVFGVPDEEMGEQVKAVIQPVDMTHAGPDLEAKLIAFCRERLSPIKCPRSVDFETELPRTPTGKLIKRHLRDRYWPNAERRV